MEQRDFGVTPWQHRIVLLLMLILACLIMASSSSVLDTARDVYNAWQVADGGAYPMEGPYFAGTIHSGPIWFYILATPLFLTPSWLVLAMWVGLLAGLKYLLAYSIGVRLGDRNFGLIWACLLALPNWTAINYLIFSHTNLVETSMLFGIYSLVRWLQGSNRWFAGLCLAVSLGFHAHPTMVALGIFCAPLVVLALFKRQLNVQTLLAGVGVALLPWIPYLVSQHGQQWPDLYSGNSYVGTLSFLENLKGWHHVVWGALADGPVIMLRGFLGLQGAGLWAASVFLLLLFSTGLVLALHACVREKRPAVPVALMLLTVVAVVCVAMLRPITQFYMVLLLYPPFCGLAAWGWARAPANLGERFSRVFAGIALLFLTWFAVANLDMGKTGNAAIPRKSLADVRSHALTEFSDGFYYPAWGRSDLGEFICAHPDDVFMHGTAALILEHSYALEARMRCERGQIFLGGLGAGSHYLAITQHEADILGISSDTRIGPLHLFDPVQTISPGRPEPVPVGDVYPPRTSIFGNKSQLRHSIETGAGEWLAITNLFDFWMAAEVEVMLNGIPAVPVFRNSFNRYFYCKSCAREDVQQWLVTIEAPEPERVEVVTFTPRLLDHVPGSSPSAALVVPD